MTDPSPPVLELRGIHRGFGKVQALRGADLVIDRPQVVGLIGRNGAGKSTLLKMIPCLLRAGSGTVRVFGEDPWLDQERILDRIGWLGQDDFTYGAMQGRDLLEAAAAIHRTWDAALVERLLRRFDLDPRRRLSTLSGGQRRAVALILAIGHRPELLVLDEPAAGLDPVVRRELLEAVVELLAEVGSTVILSSHQFADLERLAERVVILHQGRTLHDSSLEALRQASRVETEQPLPAGVLPNELIVASTVVGGRPRCTVRLDADAVRQRLAAAAITAQVVALPLEELFIAWTGGAP